MEDTIQQQKPPTKRSLAQNRSLHLGCTQIADILVENNISLQVAFKNMEVRPTMEVIKGIFRQIANAKFNVTSTAELTTGQIDKVWEDLIKPLSENTGIYFEFPNEKSSENYLQSLEKTNYETRI